MTDADSQYRLDLTDQPLLSNQFGDRYFNAVNGGSFNQLGAHALFDEYFFKTLNQSKTLYIIIGTDSGLLANYVSQRCHAPGAHYCFVELTAVSERLSECGVHFPEHPQVSYHTVETWQAVCQQAPLVYYLYHKQCEVIQSMAVLDGVCVAYQQLRHHIERQVQHLLWTIQGQMAGEAFLIQQLANCSENQVPATVLRKAFTGKTAIVLAGGPSLDASLDWVKAHRDVLLVVAVSRIAKRLQQVDLTPDIVVAIDPTDKMFTVSADMLRLPASVLFVNADHVTPQLLAAWPHRRVYCGHRLPWDTTRDNDNIPAQGPTVTNTAVALCIDMGCARILLAGADLCYTAEGYTHAKGSNEHAAGPKLGFVGQHVTCYNGEVADTDPAFYQAIDALRVQASRAAECACELINVAPRAACVDGIRHQRVADIKLDDAPVDAERVFTRVYPSMTQSWFLQDYATLSQQLKQGESKLLACQQRLAQCRSLNQQQTRAADTHKLTRMEKKLNKDFASWLSVLKRFHLQAFQSFFGEVAQDLSTLARVKAATDSYLNALATSAQCVFPLLTRAQTRVQSRQLEWQHPARWAMLIDAWQQDRQPGRVLVWEQRHHEKQVEVGNEVRAVFEHALADVQQLIARASTVVLTNTQANASGMDLETFKRIQRKSLMLYRAADAVGLQALLKQLPRQSGDAGAALQALCAGYLSELLQEYDEAINFYHLSSEFPLSRELALNHLTSLLIQCHDNDNALLALACLCQISQGYCISYAKLLAQAGQKGKAIAVLERYLDESPDDSHAKVALTELRKTQRTQGSLS